MALEEVPVLGHGAGDMGPSWGCVRGSPGAALGWSPLSPGCWEMSQAIIQLLSVRRTARPRQTPETPGEELGLGSPLQPPRWAWVGTGDLQRGPVLGEVTPTLCVPAYHPKRGE